jgi:ethanolamine utilization protein EutA
MNTVRLVGLDFGTTTSGCVIAQAQLTHNAVSGRQELSAIREDFRSELVFTPYHNDGLDTARLQRLLDEWLTAGGISARDVFGGGALLTGLAAHATNAAALSELIRTRLGNALVATADDPCLEAWLAFQASASALSKSHSDRWVINLDIGGGTTNIAIGKGGEVVRTGSLYVGARHVQVVPGTYQIANLSEYADRLLAHLGIDHGSGDCLDASEVDAILDFYVHLLEGAVNGAEDTFADPIARLHQQVPFEIPPELKNTEVENPIVTLSGGVGELVYRALEGQPLPATTFFGDLGIDLSRRLSASPQWSDSFRQFRPACAGRATVYGLLLHTTQISGSTMFLPDPAMLPLANVPIFGCVKAKSTEGQIRDILQLVARSPHGGCLQIEAAGRGAAEVAALGEKIAMPLAAIGFPSERPLVLLAEENIGKVLGQYVSRWGAFPLKLLVLDEIATRDARFVQIGGLHNQVVPVSFYGMN